MNKEEQILSATLRDKFRQCEYKDIITHSGFLSPADVNIAESFCISEKAQFVLEGGYEDAERRICVFLPDWAAKRTESSGRTQDDLLAVIRIEAPKLGKSLTHRDYLGAMLGLGLQRSVIGDIIVRNDGADAVVLREMADFLQMNLVSVGRSAVNVSVCSCDVLQSAKIGTEQIRDTVASVRLDSVLASAFRIARGKAQDAVRQGLVSVNGRQCLKPDMELSKGDRISLRGKGKAILSEVGGRTRKDRVVILIDKLK